MGEANFYYFTCLNFYFFCFLAQTVLELSVSPNLIIACGTLTLH